MTQQILQDFSTHAILEAIEGNFVGFTSAYVRTAQKTVHVEPEFTWVMGGSSMLYYNGVFRTRSVETDADALIKKLQAVFQARRQSMGWWINPLTRPTDLAERLKQHGFTFGWQDLGMAADLHTLHEPASPPPGLTIERVENEQTMRDWLHAFKLGYELNENMATSYAKLVQSVPPLQHPVGPFYLARVQGEPFATSALYRGNGVAGLYEVSTIPAARGKGIGTAIALAPLRDARNEGYRIAILQATVMGAPIYRRLGFTDYGALAAYRWSPT